MRRPTPRRQSPLPLNRRYRHVGHVFQGRHKAILCQSDPYLGRLVAYIHLNPVRAKMVGAAEDYPFSSQRAFLGIEPAGIVDVDPVLRLFGPNSDRARLRFAEHVRVASGLSHQPELYAPGKSSILGTDEFVNETIHRLGTVEGGRRRRVDVKQFDGESLLAAVECVFEISREEFCGAGKNPLYISARQVAILTGRQADASVTLLAEILRIGTSNVSRRFDTARVRIAEEDEFHAACNKVLEHYNSRKAVKQA